MKNKKGLSSFDLKILALVLMLLDHIHYFFGFTGRVPLFFSWLGRLASGLFLFTMVEGYSHTSNKKKYFKRIYLMGLAMGLVKYWISMSANLVRGDGFIPQNGIFQSFTILIVMFKAIDLLREKDFKKGIPLLLSPFLINYLLVFTMMASPMGIQEIIHFILNTFIPSPFIVEGGLFVLASGLILYLFRSNRKKQALFYGIFICAWMIILPLALIRPISLRLMFTDYYEWMGALASIIFLRYNGEKGRSMKSLFYIFYPAHVYLLYIGSVLVYNKFF